VEPHGLAWAQLRTQIHVVIDDVADNGVAAGDWVVCKEEGGPARFRPPLHRHRAPALTQDVIYQVGALSAFARVAGSACGT